MQKFLLAAAVLGLGLTGASACDFHKNGHDTTAQATTGERMTLPESTVVASAETQPSTLPAAESGAPEAAIAPSAK